MTTQSALSQFTYGNGSFDPSSVSVKSFNQQMVPGQNGRPLMIHKTLQIEGKIVQQGGGPAEVMSKLAGIYDTFSKNGRNVGFYGTPIYLDSGTALGNPGVVVNRPCSHSEVKGAEGVNYIKWNAGFEAFYPAAQTGDILAFKETVSFTSNDGLPIYVERIPVYGLPILQQVSTGSWYYATQQGSKTMAFISPDPLPMLFPGQLRTSGNNGVQVSFSSPDKLRGHDLGWTTTWKYEFISSIPFFAYPHNEG